MSADLDYLERRQREAAKERQVIELASRLTLLATGGPVCALPDSSVRQDGQLGTDLGPVPAEFLP